MAEFPWVVGTAVLPAMPIVARSFSGVVVKPPLCRRRLSPFVQAEVEAAVLNRPGP
jgi:hypothetical protein